jgi:tetratricopeptide (TPR) repeat protein
MEEVVAGEGAVVLVAGENGVGKSRLVAELAREAAGRGIWCLSGNGDPARSDLAYGAFLGVLRACMQHGSSRQRRVVREMVEGLAPHLCGSLFPRARRRSRADAAAMNPDFRQVLFLARLTRLLLEEARQHPVLLCLDDLHWADSASLQLLGHLARKSAAAPVMIVAIYRSEAPAEQGTAHLAGMLAEFHRNPHVEELRLGGLSTADTRVLISSCYELSEFSEEFYQRLYCRTRGVPLFILQYLEFLQEKGVLCHPRGLWVDRPWEELAIPDSTRGVMQQRAEGLSQEQRDLLSHAAVQGEVFEGELVAQTMACPRTRVLRELGRLAHQTHLVHGEARGFRFEHPLLVEVFYDRLPDALRRRVHLLLADRLEQRRPGDVEVLAHHFYCAGSPVRALPYLVAAGERARAASACPEARRFLKQTLEVTDQLDAPQMHAPRLAALSSLAGVAARLGEWTHLTGYCREVLRLSTPRADDAAVAKALLQLGEARHRQGEWEEATQLYREALDLFSASGDEEGRAETHVRLGCMELGRSRLEEATECFTEAQVMALKIGNQILSGTVYRYRGLVSKVRGQYLEAVLHATAALRAYRRAGHRHGICQVYHDFGMVHAAHREWRVAPECCTKGAKPARELGARDLLARCLVGRAVAQLGMGDAGAAQTSCLAARVYLEEGRDRRGLAECRKVEGMICRTQAQYPAAEERLHQSKHVYLEMEDRLGVAECERELGLVLQHRGDPDGARRCLRQSCELFGRVGALEDERRAATLLSVLAA